MAEHEVAFRIPWRSLGKQDVVFRIKQEGETFGELKISKGAVVWRPGNKKLAYHVTWERFDDAMREYGRRGEF
jgi:hypothetical protein